MKLIQVTNRYYLLFTTLILAIGSSLLFFKLKNVNNEQQEFNLILRNQQIIKQIKNGDDVPELYPYIEVKSLQKPVADKFLLKNTYILNPYEDEKEAYREFICYKKINHKYYKITTRNALLDSDDYFSDVLLTIAIIFISILIGLGIINLIVTKKIWKTFRNNLEIIKNFSVESKEVLHLKKSKITEFTALNNTIEELVNKAQKEFTSLKEFTENASHELQTPLAIIQTNVENLIQNLKLDKQQSKMIENIGNATNKMSSLTQSLLLLAKIDNNQYERKSIVNISEIINHQLNFYNDLLIAKKITLQQQIESNVNIEGNKALTEILISNLINNAIKHNLENGQIEIILSNKKFIISNTGNLLITPANSLFERFKKASNKNNSIGLGLAIAKKITNYFNWKIDYQFQNNKHNISILFK